MSAGQGRQSFQPTVSNTLFACILFKKIKMSIYENKVFHFLLFRKQALKCHSGLFLSPGFLSALEGQDHHTGACSPGLGRHPGHSAPSSQLCPLRPSPKGDSWVPSTDTCPKPRQNSPHPTHTGHHLFTLWDRHTADNQLGEYERPSSKYQD